jgi:methionyl-tRNA synthetase
MSPHLSRLSGNAKAKNTEPIMEEATPAKEVIQYDDFAKLDLRVGTVVEVGDHPNADKLLVLKVDIGGEQRQIVAGLRGFVSHEQLLGSQIVVVANLAPRKMRGLESQGMLLAASWTETEGEGETATTKRFVVPLTPSLKTPSGSSVS